MRGRKPRDGSSTGVLSLGRYHRPDAEAPDLARRHDRHRRTRAPSETSPRSRSSSSPHRRRPATIRRTSSGASSRSLGHEEPPEAAGAARTRPSRTAGPTCTSRVVPRSTTCATPRRSSPWWPTPSETTQVSVEPEERGDERAPGRGAGALGAGGWASDRAARASLAGAPATRAGRRSRLGRQPFGSPGELAVGAHARAAGTARACCSAAPDRDRSSSPPLRSRPRSRSSNRSSSRSSWRLPGCSSRSREWLAARAARRHAYVQAAPLSGTGAFFGEDPSWFGSPAVERAAIDAPEDEDTQTRLPAPATD